MPATDVVSVQPSISVIVPARNEEACLGACLQSLVSQKLPQKVSEPGLAFEIIVVDDHSTDRTHQIAASFSRDGVRVIDAGPLPQGWTGKNNAVAAGARVARGQWLLFTDADTIHLSGSLARSLEEAQRRHAALLSYSPRQIVKSFWEQAVMPVIFAELAVSYHPSRVNDSGSPAAANGQYLLIAREAYDAVGGHAALAANLLEDVALARAVKRSGRKIVFRYGGDAVRTRMYRNFAQLREGWIKNLALLFPACRRLAATRALEFLLIVASAGLTISECLRRHWLAGTATGALALVLYALFMARVRRAHFEWNAILFSLLGLPIFSYLLLRSWMSHNRGVITWKDRSYAAHPHATIETEPTASTAAIGQRL